MSSMPPPSGYKLPAAAHGVPSRVVNRPPGPGGREAVLICLDYIAVQYSSAEESPDAKTSHNQINQAQKRCQSADGALDDESKQYLTAAAELRHISVSDYVRTVTVAQARREVSAARDMVQALTPDEQLAFWNALNETPALSPAQRRLGALMRGEM